MNPFNNFEGIQSDSSVRTSYHTHDAVNSPLINKNINKIANIFTGADTPTATSTVPQKIGDMYIDTAARKVYFATALSNPPVVGDFTIVN